MAGLAVLLLLVQFFLGSGTDASEVQIGGVYTVEDGSAYRVVKVLDFDDDDVHLRLYANEYAQRPATVAANDLDTDVIESGAFGIGHIPISRERYEETKPVFLYLESITDGELERYRAWEANGGGVFGNDE